jgi:thiol-disulfide isomerase/thioredoxin
MHMNRRLIARLLGLAAIALVAAPDSLALEPSVPESTVRAADGTDLPVYKYRARGDYLLIWLATRFGFLDRSVRMAPVLADKGLEVWQFDLAVAQFEPPSTKVMREATGQYIADLIDAAHTETGKKVVLLGQSYGAIPLLRGARQWQSRDHAGDYLAGAILFSPDLIGAVPAAGQEPEYLPIAYETNIPILLYQEEKRGNRWYVNQLADALISGGSETFVGILPGVMAVFVEDDDAPETLAALDALPDRLLSGTRFLDRRHRPTGPARKATRSVTETGHASIMPGLRPFQGNFDPPAIALDDVNGTPVSVPDYRGRVTVVNFWATWCPPCVKEIPSLNRLREVMAGKPFELVAINYAQSPEEVRAFLKQVDVDFRVLTDPTGEQAKEWRVAAFPTSFIVGRTGKIRYGVSAAIDWDGPEVIDSLNELLAEVQ